MSSTQVKVWRTGRGVLRVISHNWLAEMQEITNKNSVGIAGNTVEIRIATLPNTTAQLSRSTKLKV